ncbi:MAG TPA: hypothetical protein VFZ31_06945 [Vicinamibacterales bacterium]
MAVQYSGHMVRTRQQAVWQNTVVLLVLLPIAAWRLSAQPIGAAVGLSLLALAPFALAYQAWRFLQAQEVLHQEPTPEMTFVFRFLANTPLTFGGLMLVVLSALR